MSKKKKIVSLVVAMALIAAIGIGATLAYLSDTAGTVENTFAVGEVGLNLWETAVGDTEADSENGQWTSVGNSYDFMPGIPAQTKDPFVELVDDSEDAYVFMAASGLDASAAAGVVIDGINANWTKVAELDGSEPVADTLDGIYAYATQISAGGVTEPLFETVELVADYTGDETDEYDALDEQNMTFKAAAIQYAGLEGATSADLLAALPTDWAN